MDTITTTMRQAAAAIALSTLRALGREDLIPYLWIDWKEAFTSRMGDALYATNGQRVRRSSERFRIDGTICRARFSIPLWVRATEEDRRQTVIHEVCHLVAAHEAHLAGRKVSSAHGYEWKAVMRRAGVRPKRCHNVSTKGLGKKTIPAHCACGDHYLTPLVAGRIIVLQRTYTCGRCHGQVLVDSAKTTQAQIAECRKAVANDVVRKEKRRGLDRRFAALAAILEG
jgi:predicted SprT family Zn-dependent metalloprotease